ncbi:MAG TPA: hypothetical protein V6C84_18785 [Coleofasciculaceae cyanobacterium]|jgi:hypothetical protein
MPKRPINDLTPAEKTQVALECIVLQAAGNPKASDHLATKYSLSKRSITQLKNAALKAIKDAFSPVPEVPASGLLTIDAETLSRNLSSLLESPTAIKPSSKPTLAAEDDDSDEPDSEEPVDIEEVYSAILEWNQAGNTPPIYVSAGILEKIGSFSKSEVKQWVAAHQKEIKEHNDRYKLDKSTNLSKGMRDLSAADLREKLGLLDN